MDYLHFAKILKAWTIGSFTFAAMAAPLEPSLAELELKVWQATEAAFPELEKQVTRIIQVDPNSSFGHYLLSYLFLRNFGHNPSDLPWLKKAADLAQQSIDLAEDQPHGYAAIADILDALGQTEQAISILQAYRKTESQSSWQIEFTLARVGSHALDDSAFFNLLDRSMSAPNAQTEIISPYIVAVLKEQHGDRELVTELKRWQSRFPTLVFQQTLANTLSNLHQYQESHLIYQELHKNTPALWNAQINDAIILSKHLGQKTKAKNLLKKLISQAYFHELEKHSQALAHAYLGSIYLEQSGYTKAREHFLLAAQVSNHPGKIVDFFYDLYRQRGAFPELAKLISKINISIPGRGDLHALLGEIQSENLQNHPDALSSYSNAIVLEPERSEFYNGMGLTYYRMNQIDLALNLFSAATKVDPRDAVAKYNKACALAVLGRKEEALADLQRALILQPQLALTALQDSDLVGLRETKLFQQLLSANKNSNSLPTSGH